MACGPCCKGFEYELLYNGEGQNGEAFVPGLIDVDQIEKLVYDDGREYQINSREHPNKDQEHRGSTAGASREICGCRTHVLPCEALPYKVYSITLIVAAIETYQHPANSLRATVD